MGGRRFVKKLGGEAADVAGVAKIMTHPIRRRQRLSETRSHAAGGSARLAFVTQLVVVAAAVEVQKASHRGEKLEGLSHRSLRRVGPEFLGRGPAGGFFKLAESGQPAAKMIIAQAAGRVFDVRLEMENRVAVFRVTLAGDLAQRARQFLTIAGNQVRDDFVAKPRKEPRVAGEVAAVEERDVEFQVIAMQFAAIRERVSGRADLQVEVPQSPRDCSHTVAMRFGGPFVREQKEQIDIGAGEQFPATVPPNAVRQKFSGPEGSGEMISPKRRITILSIKAERSASTRRGSPLASNHC